MASSWAPPEEIFDGAMVWTIKIVDVVPDDPSFHTKEDEELHAYTDSTTNTIYLKASLPSSRMKQTLLHEIIHVLHFGMSSHKQDNNEAWVDDFSHALLRFMESNPGLIPAKPKRKCRPKSRKAPESS